MKKFVLYFMLFGIVFISVSEGLINNSYAEKGVSEELYGDFNDEYIFNFNEVTIEGEKIVLFDNRGGENIQYYVMEFSGDQYVCYAYYYMGSHQRYTEKYVEVSRKIVDYNYDEYMIKTLEFIEYGTYEEIIESLKNRLEDNVLYMVY